MRDLRLLDSPRDEQLEYLKYLELHRLAESSILAERAGVKAEMRDFRKRRGIDDDADSQYQLVEQIEALEAALAQEHPNGEEHGKA